MKLIGMKMGHERTSASFSDAGGGGASPLGSLNKHYNKNQHGR